MRNSKLRVIKLIIALRFRDRNNIIAGFGHAVSKVVDYAPQASCVNEEVGWVDIVTYGGRTQTCTQYSR